MEPKRILIVGPYGGVNLGDEFILSEIARHVSNCGFDVVATSVDPDHTLRCHGLPAIEPYRPRQLRFTALRRAQGFDALVIGGGEQFSEPRIPNPVWGLLAQAAAMAQSAKRAGKPVFVWGVGVDAGISIFGRLLLRHVFAGPNVTVTVRDARSAQRLEAYGHPRREVLVTADPVFGLPPLDRGEARKAVRRECLGSNDRGPLILVCPSNDQLHSLRYLPEMLGAAIGAVHDRGGAVLGLLMDNRPEGDQALFRFSVAGVSSVRWLSMRDFDRSVLRRLFAGVDVLISTRMHPIIIAATQGTPWLGIARSAKMRSMFEALDVAALDIETATAADIRRRLDYLLDGGGDALLSRTSSALTQHIARAELNVEAFGNWVQSWAPNGLYLNQ